MKQYIPDVIVLLIIVGAVSYVMRWVYLVIRKRKSACFGCPCSSACEKNKAKGCAVSKDTQ